MCVYIFFLSFSLLDQLPWGSEFMHQGMIYHVSVHLVRTWHWGFFILCWHSLHQLGSCSQYWGLQAAADSVCAVCLWAANIVSWFEMHTTLQRCWVPACILKYNLSICFSMISLYCTVSRGQSSPGLLFSLHQVLRMTEHTGFTLITPTHNWLHCCSTVGMLTDLMLCLLQGICCECRLILVSIGYSISLAFLVIGSM